MILSLLDWSLAYVMGPVTYCESHVGEERLNCVPTAWFKLLSFSCLVFSVYMTGWNQCVALRVWITAGEDGGRKGWG